MRWGEGSNPLRVEAARDGGARDARLGQQPSPWPWDDGGVLEAAYLEGYIGDGLEGLRTAAVAVHSAPGLELEL